MRGATLIGERLDDRDFHEADFTGANLTGASLRRANLEGASIEQATLFGADLYQAQSSSFEATLKSRRELLREHVGSIRKSMVVALSFLTYTAVTVVTSKDEVVLTNTGTMDVPVLGLKVSPHAFIISTCVVAFALVLYLHVQVLFLARLLARMPARFPDGYRLELADAVDAWLLSLLGLGPTLSGGRPSRLQSLIWQVPSQVIRWLLPCTIALTGWRFAAANSWVQGVVLSFLLAASIALNALWPAGVARRFERDEPPMAPGVPLFGAALVLVLLARPVLWRTFGAYWPDGLQFAMLEGARLPGANFSRANLFSAKLGGANLHRASLRDAYLHEAQLVRADLRRVDAPRLYAPEANFDGARLQSAFLPRANLFKASFVRADGPWIHAAGARLQQANLSNGIFHHGYFVGVQAVLANMENATVADANLSWADLRSVDARGLKAWRADFSGSNLTRANFQGATLTDGTRFVSVTAEHADFTGARLSDAVIRDSNFSSALFVKAGLWKARLIDVTLDGARFDEAPMSGVRFEGGSLKNANFEGADLWSAVFDRCVDLTGARFNQAKLGNVKFRRVRGLELHQLAQARVQPSERVERCDGPTAGAR